MLQFKNNLSYHYLNICNIKLTHEELIKFLQILFTVKCNIIKYVFVFLSVNLRV